MENSPADSVMAKEPREKTQEDLWTLEERQAVTKTSSTLNVFISGTALFSDGYNAQIIGYMEALFANLYKHTMSKTIKTRLSNSYLIGEIFGMLFFGSLIDRMGRRMGVIATTLFLILGIVLATAAHGTSELGMFWMMIVARGVAGFGAGGEYPVCGSSATEAADETARLRRRRGILVALTTDFAVDLGMVAAGIVSVIVLSAYDQKDSEGVWRITFGLGVVLPLAVCFFRIRMINSTQYKKHSIKSNYPYLLVLRRYWRPMVGTAMAWFCYDFVALPFGLFSSTIVAQLVKENTSFQNIAYGTAINCFLLPGCMVGGVLMDRIGRKQTMTLGFFAWGIWAFILGGALGPIQSVFPLFIIMYGIFQALGEMGPGVATFLCGAESFPTPLRGHFLGFAAAAGKAGAAIGTQVFTPIQSSFHTVHKGQQAVFLIAAAFTLVGGVLSWIFIPDMSRELETEDARFKAYLEENGYDISCYGEALVVRHRD
ncbi:hypothetical protein N7456_002708 [Penicillium angulare]|uniref:Major facilitator superfamily (MFS) profile domain-containing protein n=1 Tax=Penicillium angulare TaxID=116970 RepID=A0A9W9G8M2_9EURO|nr:hypothetical protein N7456_002708 [Penicillium angulare]